MKDYFKHFFNQHMKLEATNEGSEAKIRIASAALMIEVARADFDLEASELERIEQLLKSTLGIEESELIELIEMAKQESKDSTSLHSFTRLIHESYSEQEKLLLFENLWHVAYANGELDKYEEYVLRKISELIYLSHQHFIQSKHKVLKELGLPLA